MEDSNISYWLGEVSVCIRDSERAEHSWWPESMPYSVLHPERGYIGLFASEREAFEYRLFCINKELNG